MNSIFLTIHMLLYILAYFLLIELISLAVLHFAKMKTVLIDNLLWIWIICTYELVCRGYGTSLLAIGGLPKEIR